MKHKLNQLRILIVLCAAFGWWGFLYPEYSITSDMVRLVSTEDGTENTLQGDDVADGQSFESAENLYRQLLKAGRNNIRFRSKLLTDWNAFWEACSWEKLTKN